MRVSPYLAALALFAAIGCQQYRESDATLLGQHGGHFILSGEGPGQYMAPVGAVIFDDEDHPLSDDEFAAVFPAVRQMDPAVMLLRGRHTISDRSIPLLNQLRAVHMLDVSGTRLTLAGLKALHLKYLRDLTVSPDRFSESDAAELRHVLSLDKVSRWQPATRPSRVGS